MSICNKKKQPIICPEVVNILGQRKDKIIVASTAPRVPVEKDNLHVGLF
tara:strand:+ start:908 stop:1054 length:147 start_codon:yes stop_codon:yes gene_type:complete